MFPLNVLGNLVDFTAESHGFENISSVRTLRETKVEPSVLLTLSIREKGCFPSPYT